MFFHFISGSIIFAFIEPKWTILYGDSYGDLYPDSYCV
jgi:hypothetical protein